MKIAILHEMLIKLGGAEKVVENISNIYPNADIYTLIYDAEKVWKVFPKSAIHPSCKKLRSQKIYNITKKQRLCLPFMRSSVESLDFSAYDRVIVSSSWFAHWLKTWKNTKTIIYYHAPARYIWDWTHEYRRDIWMNSWIKWFIYGALIKNIRIWDYHAAQDNDILLSNSATTRSRVQKYFRRDSQIVYPPIETQRFAKQLSQEHIKNIFSWEKYYIILSALTEFKRLDVAITAFNQMPEVNVLIIWEWEYRKNLEELSWESKNIKFAWAQYGDDLVSLVQNSSGLIFPWEEDFWIVPIEVMAAGKPVFALYKWWLTETVIAWKTGDFFYNPDGSDFTKNFIRFHQSNLEWKYHSENCKKQATKFDIKIFGKQLKSYMK